MKFVPRLGVWFRFTEDELLNEIRRVVAANGGLIPRPSTFDQLSKIQVRTIKARFGSYEKAITRAGYSYVHNAAKYTRKDIESDLRKILTITDRYRFSHKLYKKSGGLYADATIKHLMNATNWDDVMSKIGAKRRPHVTRITPYGLRRRKLADLSKDELLDEIGRVWKFEGRRPKYIEFHQKSTFGMRVFERRFGSWVDAVDAYCKREGIALQGCSGTHATNEVLLAELRSVRRKRPKDLLTYDFYRENEGTYSIGTFQAHFGSWAAAVSKVDALSGKRRKYSTDQLFDELQRVWEELGRQPSSNEMQQKGIISPNAYKLAFGSWTKAIVAFCNDRNKEIESLEPKEIVEREATSLAGTEALLPSQVSAADADVKSKKINSALQTESGAVVILRRTSRYVSTKLRFNVWNRDKFTCQICGKSKKEYGDKLHLEVDHKVAYSKGGETTIENLWTLCRDCNNGKSDSPINLDLFPDAMKS